MNYFMFLVMEEPIMVKYDGTVRNSLGDAIQFLYGTTK
jgi:hypothetical protein